MKKIVLFGVISLAVFSSWRIQKKTAIKKAEWLIGTWENKTQRGSIYETWTKINAFEFSGKSYMLKEKDTIVFETIRIVQKQDSLFYIPTVKNQNNNSPVRFALKLISKKTLVFEISNMIFRKS